MKKSPTVSVSLLLAAFALSSLAFGQDVRRKTIAITYLKDPVTVILAGTTLRPNAKGEATGERWRKRNESEIEVTSENMVPAYNYGADYTTYVLWAITPAGQADNLGEFRLSGSTARLKAATPQQTFAMIERDYNKTPPELLQARRAVQIARLANAERFDPANFSKALASLNQAEDAFRRGGKPYDVGRIARDAITFAGTARDVSEEHAEAAERRADIARRDAEVRRATESASDLSSQLSDTQSRLKASEIARINAQDQLDRVMREAADSRAENRSLKSENDRLRNEVDRLNQDLTEARGRISDLQSQYSSTKASLNETSSKVAEMERIEREKQQAEARRRDFEALRASVAAVLTIKPSGNGFVATLPDSYFVPNLTTLHVRAKSKMDSLGRVIASHRDATFVIEGHADARPNADAFALARAQAVADYLAALGVSRTNIRVESRGATVPISTRKTLAARAMNRRVELVFTGPQ